MSCPDGIGIKSLIVIVILASTLMPLTAATGKQSSRRESSECDGDSLHPCMVGTDDSVTNTVAEMDGKSANPTADQDPDGEANSEKTEDDLPGDDPYDVGQGRYWLVPPFLIGASSVIVLYIIVYCIYLHCYAKKRMRKLEENNLQDTEPNAAVKEGPDVVGVNDPLPPDGASVPPVTVTPVVRYDGAYGKTEVVEAQPFLVCQPLEPGDESVIGSIQFQLPTLFAGGRSESKPSVSSSVDSCSVVGALDTEDVERSRATRASICFAPVGHTVKDPSSNGQTEWTPLQGFMYSSFVLRKPSYNQAVINCPVDGETQSNELQQTPDSIGNVGTDDEVLSPPIIVVPTDRTRSFQTAEPTLSGQEDQEKLGDISITVSTSG